MIALGINNAWIDSAIQEKAYINFAHNNTYRRLISETQRDTYLTAYENNCLPAVTQCTETGTDDACKVANSICYGQIEGPIIQDADFNVYDIRAPRKDPEPPSTYVNYLQREDVRRAIGARGNYSECANAVAGRFQRTGDSKFLSLLYLSDRQRCGC